MLLLLLNQPAEAGGITGSWSVLDAADTFAASGDIAITGAWAASDGADTFAATGTVGGSGISGAWTVADLADAFTASGTVATAGAMALQDAADTFSATGSMPISGALAVQDAQDAFAAASTMPITGAMVVLDQADAFAATGESLADVTITGAQAALLYRLALLHGLDPSNPLQVTGTERRAGGLVQSISGSSTVVIQTTATPTTQGQAGDWIEALAALHGLTGPLTVTGGGRSAGAVSQEITRVGDTTTVQRV